MRIEHIVTRERQNPRETESERDRAWERKREIERDVQQRCTTGQSSKNIWNIHIQDDWSKIKINK